MAQRKVCSWRARFLVGLCCLVVIGCSREVEPLVIYSGKGLRNAMEEVVLTFEQEYRIPTSVVFAGSDTLLATLEKTRRGDVFVPGSALYLKRAGDLVVSDQYVARHVPSFAVRRDNPGDIDSFVDLLRPGVRLAVGNPDMCAVGRVAADISQAMEDGFEHNVVVTGSTVNELLDLVVQGEVDAALVWADMLQWPQAEPLRVVPIPAAINRPKEIRVAVLATTTDREHATLFADFVATRGREIFRRHGFGGE